METAFDLQHANLLAYLTHTRGNLPPRVTGARLLDFVTVLTTGSGPLAGNLSRDERLQDEMDSVSYGASELVRSHIVEDEEFVDERLSLEALAGYRRLCHRYAFFGLPVGEMWGTTELEGFWKRLSAGSSEGGLLFEPASPRRDRSRPRTRFECYDPSPILRPLASQPEHWPGVLYWDGSGTAAFVPVREAGGLYRSLSEAVRQGPRRVTSVLEEHSASRADGANSRLVHVSDLHFGSDSAGRHHPFLSAHLGRFLGEHDVLLITGDLVDNARRRSLEDFERFVEGLEAAAGCKTILVPGNRDQGWLGARFLSSRARRRLLERTGPWTVDVDEARRSVLFRFNSAAGDAPSGGRIGSDQLERVGTEFETKRGEPHRLHSALRVAVVHHHPFAASDAAGPEIVRFRQQPAAAMPSLENDGAFLDWCVDQHVSLILHGHGHRSTILRSGFDQRGGPLPAQVELVAIGCGSSLAVRDEALCYNVVEWSASQRVWSCRFYASRDTHSGFKEQLVTVEAIDAP